MKSKSSTSACPSTISSKTTSNKSKKSKHSHVSSDSSRISDPLYSNNATTVSVQNTSSHSGKSSHVSSSQHSYSNMNSNSGSVSVSIPISMTTSSSSYSSLHSNTLSESSSNTHSHNSHSSHSSNPRSHKSSNSHKSRKFSSHSNQSSLVNTNNKTNKNNTNSFKNTILFSIVIALTLAATYLSQSKYSSLSPLDNLKSSMFGNSYNKNAQSSNANTRYIRSVSSESQESQNNNNDSMSFNSIMTRVQNGVTEMYNQNIKNTLNTLLGSSPSSNSNMAKNGKLHYIPSSGNDPTKTAHHVLEGAGYRLNIPSYVQSVPVSSNGQNSQDSSSQDSTNNNDENENNQINSNSAVVGQNNININNNLNNPSMVNQEQISNKNFDQAITQKQAPLLKATRSFSANTQPLAQNGIVKQAVFNPNDVPISSVDPVLDSIIKEMLEKREQDLKNSNSAAQVLGGTSTSGSNTFDAVKKLNTTEIFSKNSELGQCKPSNNVVFAKTHKTGGTTITNMLLRHAEKQKLNVALPVEYHWELAGYPAPFEEQLITPKQPQYDVMCHHMRFDKSKIEKMVNPLTDYFTILRDPVTNFESSFGFFKDYPFTDWLDNDRNIDDFINNADQYYNKSTPWYFRAKNYMSFDLGFDHENNSDDYIRQAIAKMEEDFKFVMITDRYEESMILLKNMLCLDYDDIVYLPLKVRTDNDRKKISSEAAAKIKKWNRLDTAIYEYFAQRFEQMTIDYGKEKLANEVQILREKLKDVEARCVEDYDSQSLKPWIKRIKLRKPSGQKCQRLVWGEVKYADYLRQLQYSQLSEEEYNEQPKLDDKIELMQEVQRSILGDETNM